MGYRIVYGPMKKARGVERRYSRLAALTGLFLVLFAAAVCCFWPEGAAVLRDWLLPGDPAVTAAAMEELSDSLRTGEDLFHALRTFCIRILEGAGLAASG